VAFAITYRHVSRPLGAAMTIVGNEMQITEAVARLERDGYEVTGIDPPPINLILLGKAPPYRH
jgi:hypothetical protein